jgi:hypothetical protein
MGSVFCGKNAVTSYPKKNKSTNRTPAKIGPERHVTILLHFCEHSDIVSVATHPDKTEINIAFPEKIVILYPVQPSPAFKNGGTVFFCRITLAILSHPPV